MQVYRKITGEKCYLSPWDASGAEIAAAWFNDIGTAIPLQSAQTMISVESEIDWLRDSLKNGFHVFAVVEAAADKVIGSTWISEIDFVNRKAMFGIVIGEKDYRGKGFAREAATLVLDYAFNLLNLHSVALEVFEFNKRAIALYESLGFKTIGRRRSSRTVCGKSCDTLYMDILDREFTSPAVAKYAGGRGE